MPDSSTFGLFFAASLVFLVVPGPSVLYIVARSVEGGRAAGLLSMLGVQAGALVHVAFAARGISAILASSASAFSAVKVLGAAYLVWLGLRRLLARDEEDHQMNVEPESLSRLFTHGVVVNVLNPKTALFFLAFLPQFADPSRGMAWAQITILGVAFVSLAACTDGLYALLGGTAGDWLKRKNANPRFRKAQRYLSGSVYIALGAVTAVSGSGKK